MKMALRKIVVWASLIVFLVFISAVEAGKLKPGVTFSGTKFTMTCPESPVQDWFINEKSTGKNDDTYTTEYDNKVKGPHYCQYGGKKYYFYVQGKACKDCFELDPIVFVLAIILDVVVTAVLMMIIYKFGKRRSSGGSSNASRGPTRSGPPAPSSAGPSAYESLNPKTRNQETYSKLNRMG